MPKRSLYVRKQKSLVSKSLRYSFLSSLSAARDISSKSGERRVYRRLCVIYLKYLEALLSAQQIVAMADRCNTSNYFLRDTNSKLAILLPQTNVKKNSFPEQSFGMAPSYILTSGRRSPWVLRAGCKQFFRRSTQYLRKAD